MSQTKPQARYLSEGVIVDISVGTYPTASIRVRRDEGQVYFGDLDDCLRSVYRLVTQIERGDKRVALCASGYDPSCEVKFASHDDAWRCIEQIGLAVAHIQQRSTTGYPEWHPVPQDIFKRRPVTAL